MEKNLGGLVLKGTFKDPEDGCVKGVYESQRGISEFTFIPNKSEENAADVYCVPTHHYCNLGCKMCHLTAEGIDKGMVGIKDDEFIRALTLMTYKNKNEFIPDNRRTNNKKLLISYMGVGEPLLNQRLIKRVFEKEGLLKSMTHYESVNYALATMMPNDSLLELTDYVKDNQMPLKVHFSLHSPFSDERFDLLPKTKVDVERALDLLKYYEIDTFNIKPLIKPFHNTDDNVEIHYTLIEGVNDSDRHLEELISLNSFYRFPIKFLRFNPANDLKISDREDHWLIELQDTFPDLNIVFYNPPGDNIGSSCGEFTKHYYLSELEKGEDIKEFLEWKNKFEIFE